MPPTDEKTTELSIDSNPAATDLAYGVKDPAGTPQSVGVYWGTHFTRGYDALFGKLQLGVPSELTISSGAITLTGSRHYIDTEADAASDELETINGGAESMLAVLSPANAGRSVVLKHGVGNILCVGDADITLSGLHSFAIAVYDDSSGAWFVLQGGGGGGGVGDALQTVLTAQVFS